MLLSGMSGSEEPQDRECYQAEYKKYGKNIRENAKVFFVGKEAAQRGENKARNAAERKTKAVEKSDAQIIDAAGGRVGAKCPVIGRTGEAPENNGQHAEKGKDKE
jgi:hypothetical protein